MFSPLAPSPEGTGKAALALASTLSLKTRSQAVASSFPLGHRVPDADELISDADESGFADDDGDFGDGAEGGEDPYCDDEDEFRKARGHCLCGGGAGGRTAANREPPWRYPRVERYGR